MLQRAARAWPISCVHRHDDPSYRRTRYGPISAAPAWLLPLTHKSRPDPDRHENPKGANTHRNGQALRFPCHRLGPLESQPILTTQRLKNVPEGHGVWASRCTHCPRRHRPQRNLGNDGKWRKGPFHVNTNSKVPSAAGHGSGGSALLMSVLVKNGN